MSHVFISYSRKDLPFAQKIVYALAANGLDTWIDWKSIPKGEDWWVHIQNGIEEADAFIFLVSPDSIKSKVCSHEIEHAVINGKRILAVVIYDVAPQDAHPEISKRNWIFCREGQDDFEKAILETRETIHTDFAWLKYHTELQVKALRWELKQDNSRLLRGKELREAEEQMAKVGSQIDPQPTDVQRQYILSSSQYEVRRQRNAIFASLVALIVSATLGMLAFINGQNATKNANNYATQVVLENYARATAEAEKIRAEKQAKLALSRQLAAQSNNQLSVNNELSLLLAIESGNRAETFEADSALRDVLRVVNRSSGNVLTTKIFSGHANSVNYVAWDPDGERIATASADSTVKVWDAISGEELHTLSRHKGPVWYVSWDPPGERIVTTGDDGTARIWDAKTGFELATLSPQKGLFHSLAPIGFADWNPTGDLIATASDDGIPRIWNAKSGKELVALEGHTAAVTQIKWSPDGSFIATASEDSSARIWNSRTGEQIAILEGHKRGGRAWPVRNATWSPDGKKLLTYGTDDSAIIWDTMTWTQVSALAGPGFFERPHSVIRHVEWDKNGNRVVIASGSPDNPTEIWDAETGRLLVTLSGHKNWVVYATWSNDNKKVLTASWDGTARIWDAKTGEQLNMLTGHTKELVMASWSPDGRYVLSASTDHTARMWDLDPPRSLPEIQFDMFQFEVGQVVWDPTSTKVVVADDSSKAALWDIRTGEMLSQFSNGVTRLNYPEWSSDGERILMTDGDTNATIWEAVTGDILAVLPTFSNENYGLSIPLSLISNGEDEGYIYVNKLWRFASWSPDGNFIAAFDWDGSGKIWDANEYKEVIEFKATEPSTLRCMAWSPNSKYIAVAGSDAIATIWEAETGKKVAQLTGHKREISNITWSPDGLQLATASADGTARVWNMLSGAQLLVLSGHSGWVNTVSWNPDGTRLLTSSNDQTARIWDTKSGIELAILTGHIESVLNSSWNYDGTRIVTASADNTARVWDGQNGSLLSILSGHTDGLHNSAVVQAVWSPDGKYVATVGFDGKVRLHYAHISDLIALGCQNAVRNMSEIEWNQYIKDIPYKATCPNITISNE